MAINLYTGNLGYQQEPNSFVRYVDKDVYLRQPYATPVHQITQNDMNRIAVTNFKYEWQRDSLRDQFMQLIATYAGGGTMTTYTDATNISFFQVGDQIVNTGTQDVLVVTAIDAVNSIVSLSAQDGTTVITAGQVGDQIEYLATPISQGGLVQQAVNTAIDLPFNYTTTITTPLKVDTTTLRSKLYQGNQWTYLHGKKIFEHKWQYENSAIWSKISAAADTNGDYKTTMNGLWYLLSDHVSYARGGFSYAVMDAWLRDHVFRYGSRQKIVFMNNKFASDLNGSFFQTIRLNLGEEKFNDQFKLNFTTWTSAYGTVTIILMPQMQRTQRANNTVLGMAMAVEPRLLKGATLEPTYLMDNIQNPRSLSREAALVAQLGVIYGDSNIGSILYES
ncbi:MAG: DUF5309 family protein [Patescibacteria group bacterium]|nr:DUF5309 family protein [Patescibacteria group bacterium]